MMQEIRTMMEMMLKSVVHDGADQTDDVQPEEAAEPNKRYGPKRSDQIPEPLRQCAARGTLLGIRGHRRQRSQGGKLQESVKKREEVKD